MKAYNDVFENQKMSLDEFKDSYARARIQQEQLLEDAFTVGQLDEILKDKDFDDIQNLLTYYTLLKEERQLL